MNGGREEDEEDLRREFFGFVGMSLRACLLACRQDVGEGRTSKQTMYSCAFEAKN